MQDPASGFGPDQEDGLRDHTEAAAGWRKSLTRRSQAWALLPCPGASVSGVLTAGAARGEPEAARAQPALGPGPGPPPGSSPLLAAAKGLGGREAAAALESPGAVSPLPASSPSLAKSA